MGSQKVLILCCVVLALAVAQSTENAQSSAVDAYMFDSFNSTGFGTRSFAIVGSNSDLNKIFILGGENATGAVEPNYQFDLTSNKWTALAVNFSRTGACYSQDSNLNAIWIYGGVSQGADNTDPFLAFTLDSKFKAFAAPPAGLPLVGVSCAAAADGSKFYVLFGMEKDSDIFWGDDAPNCSATADTIGIFSTASNWTMNKTTGAIPTARVGAVSFVYKNSLVVFGGTCETQFSNDVYRLNLATLVWTKDTPAAGSNTPAGKQSPSAFIQQDTLVVFGGNSAQNDPHVYGYDLVKMNWTSVATSTAPDSRWGASAVALQNRAVLVGGQNGNTYYDDVLQLVVEQACMSRGCEDCTSADGCGFCIGSNVCIAGGDASAFITSTCNSSYTYITDLDSCPQIFPSYGIALLVIGGVVVVGIIIFAIMKVRGGDDKEGYERIS